MRLDKCVAEKYKLPSRTYAANLIKTGAVSVNGVIVKKTSFDVTPDTEIVISDDASFASQGAYKIAEAHKIFDFDVNGAICADLGCSNGGFTDYLLRNGAAKVLCVDVGKCVLPESILNSGKVEFLRANARSLPVDDGVFDFVCADLSFISLTLVLPEIFRILKPSAIAVTLVKPQFEAGKRALNKQGVVTDKKDREKALEKVELCALECGFEITGKTVSPVRFENKNIEYLLYLKKV